jgi:hypothetical protein
LDESGRVLAALYMAFGVLNGTLSFVGSLTGIEQEGWPRGRLSGERRNVVYKAQIFANQKIPTEGDIFS